MQPQMTRAAAERQLKSFVARFDVKNQKLINAVRSTMRKRLPTAHELVYDNYNFFVIGYSATEGPSDSIFSIAATGKGNLVIRSISAKQRPRRRAAK